MYVVMKIDIKNWLTQIKKGYLDLCILTLIQSSKKTYGFELISQLAEFGISIKEGTLYPLLNRMTKEDILKSSWVIEDSNERPRKYYSLTKAGEKILRAMQEEYLSMNKIFKEIKKLGGDNEA